PPSRALILAGGWYALSVRTACHPPWPRALSFHSDNPMQRPAPRREGSDALGYSRILFQRRRVVRLDPGVDDQRAGAAPVLLAGEGADAVNVRGRVGAGERHPQEVGQRPGSKLAVVYQDHQGKGV